MTTSDRPRTDEERVDEIVDRACGMRIVETAPGKAVPLAEVVREQLLALLRDVRNECRMQCEVEKMNVHEALEIALNRVGLVCDKARAEERAAENEACAKVVELYSSGDPGCAIPDIAEKIRARMKEQGT